MRLFASALLLAATLASPAAQAADVVLTMNSYGAIRVGMPVAEVQRELRKLGHKKLPKPGRVAKTGCSRYDASKDLGFLMENGKVVRIETREANVVTPSGLRIGSSLERVRHALGSRIEDTPHPSATEPEARSIVLISGDEQFAIRVEAAQRVTELYAGAAGAIRSPKTCR